MPANLIATKGFQGPRVEDTRVENKKWILRFFLIGQQASKLNRPKVDSTRDFIPMRAIVSINGQTAVKGSPIKRDNL